MQKFKQRYGRRLDEKDWIFFHRRNQFALLTQNMESWRNTRMEAEFNIPAHPTEDSAARMRRLSSIKILRFSTAKIVKNFKDQRDQLPKPHRWWG